VARPGVHENCLEAVRDGKPSVNSQLGWAEVVRTVGPFRRVLAGYDGSPDAADAVRAAAAIAARDGGHVVALSVVRRAEHPDGDEDGDGNGRSVHDLAESLLSDLQREMPVSANVRMSVQVVYTDLDSPAQVVTDYAKDHGFDVLVLGRHGNGRRRKTRLGQVADRAVQTCAVPVLLLSAP
jgi:nucleotide-binding universal stress UspA family protein